MIGNKKENMDRKTVTISMDAEVLQELKKLAKSQKQKKGFLGKSISVATKKWLEERKQKRITQWLMEKMEKGYDMGKLDIKDRDELYDRKL